MTETFTRDVAIDPAHTALIFIDVQNYATEREAVDFKALTESELAKYDYYFQRLTEVALPNMQAVQKAARAVKVVARGDAHEAGVHAGRVHVHLADGAERGVHVDAVVRVEVEFLRAGGRGAAALADVDVVVKNAAVERRGARAGARVAVRHVVCEPLHDRHPADERRVGADGAEVFR